jgi:protein-disulfide isomerase
LTNPCKITAVSPVESDQEDLSRKQRREQARSGRKAAEEAAASDAARRRRLAQLGGAVAVVIVAIVVILIATSGSSGPSVASKPKSAAAQSQVKAAEGVLAGTTQKGNVLGSATAPVTMQYFGDLECPVCREFTLGAFPSIVQKWVKTGKLKVEYRSFSTATGKAEGGGSEPEGMFDKQQEAALAAGRQNKAWDYIELFYREQAEEDSGYVTEAFLQGLAQQVPGLDLATWTSDRGNNALAAQIATDNQEANNQGLTGTPSFLIGKTGGGLKKYEYNSLTDPSGFYQAFEAALKG